jgi:hypothetical protein
MLNKIFKVQNEVWYNWSSGNRTENIEAERNSVVAPS